jgi:predicted nucleotide-binding protein
VPKQAAVVIAADPTNGKRKYLSQSDVPSCSLEKALEVAQAIADNYGFQPSTPLQVASALEMSPTAGPFRALTGASIAYGLTSGGYNAPQIAIEPLGMRIVRPTGEEEDILAAKKDATLRPRVIREFLQKYKNAAIPKDSIAHNVLGDLGVPPERTTDVFKMILESAQSVGFIRDINSKKYVDLQGTQPVSANGPTENTESESLLETPLPAAMAKVVTIVPSASVPAIAPAAVDPARARKVYVTHGKNRALIEPIKELLKFGELDAVVSIQSPTVSQPVPTKVMSEMRGCGAALIHVEDERHLKDDDGKEVVVLNDNVLIEIGAAMALFGERFILVVKDGVKLPSNLQGLLVQPYKGTTLDMEETVKLMKAINDMKGRPLPS